MRWHAHVIDRRENRNVTTSRWVQLAYELDCPLRVGGSVEADHDPVHVQLRTPDDQDGARGTSNDPSRDTSDQDATHAPMTAPPEDDRVRFESLRRIQHGCNRGGIDNCHISLWPAARECSSGTRGDDLGAPIEGRQ
jgi:hypothetical protein